MHQDMLQTMRFMTNLCYQIKNMRKTLCSRYCTTKMGQQCTQVVGCGVTVSCIVHAKCMNLHKTNQGGKTNYGKLTYKVFKPIQFNAGCKDFHQILAIMFFCQSLINNGLEGVVLWMINHVQ